MGKASTAQPAGVVAVAARGGQSGVGKTFSEKNSIAHPNAVALSTPTPEKVSVLPTPSGGQGASQRKRGRASFDKRGGWIEFPIKSGKRYPRRRQWKKVDGQWRKVSLGRASELELMSEQEYKVYAELRDRARAARRKARNH